MLFGVPDRSLRINENHGLATPIGGQFVGRSTPADRRVMRRPVEAFFTGCTWAIALLRAMIGHRQAGVRVRQRRSGSLKRSLATRTAGPLAGCFTTCDVPRDDRKAPQTGGAPNRSPGPFPRTMPPARPAATFMQPGRCRSMIPFEGIAMSRSEPVGARRSPARSISGFLAALARPARHLDRGTR